MEAISDALSANTALLPGLAGPEQRSVVGGREGEGGIKEEIVVALP
jgi:hypothetical protein